MTQLQSQWIYWKVWMILLKIQSKQAYSLECMTVYSLFGLDRIMTSLINAN